MTLEKLELTNFRSYESASLGFDPALTLIVGLNGSGKTNILEAVYSLFQGSSFRSETDDELLRHNTDWYKIVGEFSDGVTRELRFQPTKLPRKEIVNDGVKKRFTHHSALPVVLFEPNHLSMVGGQPALRRDYLDGLLGATKPGYKTLLRAYTKSLRQRNALLKTELTLPRLKDAVFVWDIALSQYGADIVAARHEILQVLNNRLGEEYSSIAGKVHTLAAHYKSSTKTEVVDVSTLLATLHASLPLDKLRGFTAAGPHRDDFDLLLDEKNAKHTASRGEVRTIVLALKQLEVNLVGEVTDARPVMLLDDIFSELDVSRRKKLMQMSRETQVIATSTDYAGVDEHKNMHIVTVEKKHNSSVVTSVIG